MSTSTAKKLFEYWSGSEVRLGGPASLHDLAELEKKYAVRLPFDIRDYYLTANGFVPPLDQDKNGFSFWPLRKVRLVAEFEDAQWSSDETKNCLLFADYLSLSWGYVFQLSAVTTKTPIGIVGTATQHPKWIADNFGEFVDLYISDDPRLYPNSEI
jgi:SMI1 / KNR4 family (SUKH-1)